MAESDATQTDDQGAEAKADDQGGQPDYEAQLAELRERADEAEKQARETNAAFTRWQQQNAGNENEDTGPETDAYGAAVDPEVVKQYKKIFGVDQLESKLSEYEKRELDRDKEQRLRKWEDDLDTIRKDYKDIGVPLPDSEREQKKLADFMYQRNIGDPVVAFKEMHWDRVLKSHTPKKQEEEAAQSDRSDADAPTENTAYKEALAKVRPGDYRALAEVEARFKPSPYDK